MPRSNTKPSAKSPYVVAPGEPFPPGATPARGGVNFSVFSREASHVELLLFDAHDSVEPFQVVPLDPQENRTFYFWHAQVRDLQPGVAYAYRVDGPHDLRGQGQRFDAEKVLIDAWALAQTHTLWDAKAASRPGDNLATSMRGLVVDTRYDWQGDRPLSIPDDELIIYEMHVGGFTRDLSSGVKYPGTFAGVTEKIPYLKELGINAIELLPVMAFDPQSVPERCPTGQNFWGYNTVSFFSPHPGYCVTPERGSHLDEFRDMVKALHEAGIAVILDVVFNHTAEAGPDGPTINFKGFANEFFYHLEPDDKSRYRDFTGCGNTVNCNHPVVTQFILTCLEFWVSELHVDGFRFDLASALTRGESGEPTRHAPMPWAIEFSRTMLRTKIIAEAWDAAGLYQVGYFPGHRWQEWNGLYRDDMRRFLRGDQGIVDRVAKRLLGSEDLYGDDGRQPTSSINFITAHDGFTLNDLYSYHEKRNLDNGEDNRDGTNDNASFNCGYEGETDDPEVCALRTRQIKNALTLLLISQGVPMLLAGDECRRTQRGNNNAYCQDNEISFFDWRLPEKQSDVLRFTKLLIAFRKAQPALRRARWIDSSARNSRGLPLVAWHGLQLDDPGFSDPFARALSYTLAGDDDGADLHILLNMYIEPLCFDLPTRVGRGWHRVLDTFRPSPEDILEPGSEQPVVESSLVVQPRSIVLLLTPE